MPDPKGRKSRRDRERERRRTREPGASLSAEERFERDMRDVLPPPAATRGRRGVARPERPIELPNVRVRVTGAMVGVVTLLGAAYITIAAVLDGGGINSIVSVVVGVVLFGVGLFASVLSLFPQQVSRWLRRDR